MWHPYYTVFIVRVSNFGERMKENEMFNRPKYLWLSFIAFGIISYKCRNAILHNSVERDYSLWFRYIRYEIFWGLLTLIIPAGITVLLMHIFSNYNGAIELFINIIALVYLYFGGVILSFKLYDWQIENIKQK